jgi:hypothetical protein
MTANLAFATVELSIRVLLGRLARKWRSRFLKSVAVLRLLARRSLISMVQLASL